MSLAGQYSRVSLKRFTQRGYGSLYAAHLLASAEFDSACAFFTSTVVNMAHAAKGSSSAFIRVKVGYSTSATGAYLMASGSEAEPRSP